MQLADERVAGRGVRHAVGLRVPLGGGLGGDDGVGDVGGMVEGLGEPVVAARRDHGHGVDEGLRELRELKQGVSAGKLQLPQEQRPGGCRGQGRHGDADVLGRAVGAGLPWEDAVESGRRQGDAGGGC